MEPGSPASDMRSPPRGSELDLVAGFDAARALQDDLDARRWRHRLASRLFGASAPPVRLGRRYRIEDRIGEGGMGVVYRAWDDRLRRAVAIKVVRPRLCRTRERSTRLQQEAQALARLSHPNVVAAYDVGDDAGRVFVAMELVDGPNLRRWLADSERSAAEILDVLLEAGRGLCAAHEAGLVHRDFKPDNVLVGREGRARVVDFGLALRVDELTTDPVHDAPSVSEALGTHVLGTPLYMSPEVRRGRPGDALGDQFAFCVTLREALDGVHPFAHRGHEHVLDCMLQGDHEAPPPGSRCPPWLVPILDRGLAPRPEDRWPSMGSLVQAIERRRRRGPRRSGWVLGGLGVSVSAMIVASVAWRSPDGCRDAQPRVDPAWSAARQEGLRDRILGSGGGYAEGTWARVRGAIDRFGAEWADTHRRACEATRDDVPSELRLDARMACLDARLHELDALVTVLTDTPDSAERAVAAVGTLRPPAGCLEVEPGAVPLPSEDERRAVRRVTEDIAWAEAAITVGEYETARRLAEQAVATAAPLDHGPTRAAAAFELGTAQEHAGQLDAAARNLEDAVWLATSASDDALAAEAATSLVFVLGDRLARPDEAEVWIGHARAALERAGRPGHVEARLLGNIALVRRGQGRGAQARAAYAEALEATRQAFGSEHLAVATAAHNLGLALFEAGDYEEAERLYREVIEVREAALGPGHPDVGASRQVLGPVLHRLGRYDEARAEIEQALEISLAALGPSHRQTAAARVNLGVMVQQAGDAERAVTLFTEALVALRSIHGEDHVAVADAEDGLGSALLELGRHDQARAHLRAASAIVRRLLPEGSPRIAASAANLASLHHAVGEYDQAFAAYDEALGIFEATVGEGHPFHAFALEGRGKSRWHLGEVDQGRADLEHAIELHLASGREPRRLAEARLSLAELLWETGRDPEGALGVAAGAIEALRGVPDHDPAMLSRWEAWVEDRRGDEET